jgi:hypothetical protein
LKKCGTDTIPYRFEPRIRLKREACRWRLVAAAAAAMRPWLPNWRRGFEGLQRSDLVELGLERIAEDLSVAEYVTPWADAPGPLFEGDPASVTFVRSAIGPNARPGGIGEARATAGTSNRRSGAAAFPERTHDDDRLSGVGAAHQGYGRKGQAASSRPRRSNRTARTPRTGPPYLFVDRLSVQSPEDLGEPDTGRFRMTLAVPGQWRSFE